MSLVTILRSGNVPETPPHPLSVWRAAFAARASAPVKILTVGDSVTEGQGASTKANRWIDKVRDTLRAGAPGGQNYIPSFYGVYAPDSTWGATGIANTGTNTNDEWGPNIGWRSTTMSTGATRTFTVTGTSVDIWWLGNGGTFTYQVDAGTVSSGISTAGAFSSDQRTAGISLGSAGSHTVKITATTGPVYLSGLTVYNGDTGSGVHMYDAGHTGFTAAQFSADNTNQQKAWEVIDPHLVTIEVGLNDCSSSVPAATFRDQLQAIVNCAQALSTSPSVLIIATYQPAAGSIGSVPWASYVAAMAAVASNSNAAFLDLSAVMPVATTAGTGFYSTDGLHPNDTGHAEIAKWVAAVLTPPIAAPVALTGAGNVTTAITSSAVTLDIAPPANAAVGDLLIFYVGFQNQATATPPTATPSGPVRLGPAYNLTGDTNRRPSGMFAYPIPDAAALAALPAAWTWQGTASAGRIAIICQRVTGADLTTPEDSSGAYKTPSLDTAQAHTLPAVPVTGNSRLLLGFVNGQMNSVAQPVTVAWSDGVEAADISTATSGTATSTVVSAIAQTVDAGSSGTRTATFSGSSSVANATGYMVAIAPSLVTSVTASAALSWGVRGPVAASAAAAWNVRATVTRTAGLSWSVRSVASQTAGVSWSVRSPVARSAAASWNVRQAITGQGAASWSVRQSATRTAALSWGVRVGAGAASVATSWSVRQAVTRTGATSWSVRAQVTRQAAASWDTRAAVTKAGTSSWSVRSGVAQSAALTWSVRVQVTASGSLSWDAQATAQATRTAGLSWGVRAAVTSTAATTWTVRAQVTRSIASSWSVRQTVTRTAGSSWSVRSTVTASAALPWSARGSVTQSGATSWSVRSRINRSASLSWDVGATGKVTQTLPVSWSVRQTLSVTAGVSWSVRISTTRTGAASWTVRAGATRQVSASWDVRARVTGSGSLPWSVRAIMGSPATASLPWSVRSLVGRPVLVRWDVRAEVTRTAGIVWAFEVLGTPAAGELGARVVVTGLGATVGVTGLGARVVAVPLGATPVPGPLGADVVPTLVGASVHG